MPAPTAPESWEKFQQLLQELTCEFERLQNQNLELSKTNTELLAARSRVEPPRRCSSRDSNRGLEVSCSPSVLSSSKASKVGNVVSAEKSFAAGTLQEEFSRLDIKDQGRLYVDDLARILEGADEPYEYGNLVEVVRMLNGMEPLDRGKPQWRTSVRDEVWIDLEAYERLMDESLSYSHLGVSMDRCVSSLRSACHQAVHHWDAIDRFGLVGKAQKSRQFSWQDFWLETLPTSVILCNTVVTGLSADHPQLKSVWQICEYVFAGFYTTEFLTKLGFFGCRDYFLGRECYWNLFDFVCLVISLGDVTYTLFLAPSEGEAGGADVATPLMMIKIFRLTRLARLVRTLRFRIFHELKLMVMGVFSGLRVLTWAIVLFVVLLYVVGVGLTNVLGDKQGELAIHEFDSVGVSMFTLFRCWTEGCAASDGTPLAERLRKLYGAPWLVFHILMTMFVIVGVFNLIMAVFIDNVVTAQMTRRHKEMVQKSDEIEFKFKTLFLSFLLRGVSGRRLSHNFFNSAVSPYRKSLSVEWEKLRAEEVTVSREVFKSWLENEEFQALLDEAEIETTHMFELFEVLDADMTGELSLDELTLGLMKLRGPVTKSDIVAVRLKVRHLTQALDKSWYSRGSALSLHRIMHLDVPF